MGGQPRIEFKYRESAYVVNNLELALSGDGAREMLSV